MSNATLPRRGTTVLSILSGDPSYGAGRVEGHAFYAGRGWAVVRYDGGQVGYGDSDVLAAVDADARVVPDEGNNVGRRCNVRGDGRGLAVNRCWRVVAAVSGQRLLVVHLDTAETLVVDAWRDVANLY